MQVEYLELPILNIYPKSIMAIGYFDGVHLGHQLLINKAIEEAKNKGIKSAVFTFDRNIHEVLNNKYLGSITPLDHKLDKFKKIGVDIVYILRFNEEIMSLNSTKFIEKILDKLNLSKIICGSDFRYGYMGKGNVKELSQYFDVNEVELLNMNNQKVSSSSIASLLKDGRVEEASNYLGNYYEIRSKVIKGKQNGTKLGFPTANLESSLYLLPKNGVYQVYVDVDGNTYKGIANVGCHPTIDKLSKNIVEIYIFDFSENIYNKDISVKFVHFLRDEKRFDNIEELKKQLKIDTNLNF